MASEYKKTTIVETVTYLTSQELAKRIHVHPATLANWRCQGRGPRYFPGRPVLYPIDEVQKWEKAQLRSSTAENKSERFNSGNRSS